MHAHLIHHILTWQEILLCASTLLSFFPSRPCTGPSTPAWGPSHIWPEGHQTLTLPFLAPAALPRSLSGEPTTQTSTWKNNNAECKRKKIIYHCSSTDSNPHSGKILHSRLGSVRERRGLSQQLHIACT